MPPGAVASLRSPQRPEPARADGDYGKGVTLADVGKSINDLK
jgi:hypothetical protein